MLPQSVLRHCVKGSSRRVPLDVAIPQPRANFSDFLFGQRFGCALDLLNLAHGERLQKSLIRANRVFKPSTCAGSKGRTESTEIGINDLGTGPLGSLVSMHVRSDHAGDIERFGGQSIGFAEMTRDAFGFTRNKAPVA